MTQEIKTAIKSAEQRLEDEKTNQLKQEVYDYLKHELDEIDRIESNVRNLNEEKRVHEENVKNLKAGNLQAIEERRKRVPQYATGIWTISASTTSSPYTWYNSNLAGFTYTSPISGRTYIF